MFWKLLALPPADQGPAAPASPDGGGGFGNSFMWILLAGMVLVLFLGPLFNKRERQRRARLGQLKKHDRVVTTGGIFGSIVSLEEQTATIEIAKDVRVKVKRGSIYDVEHPPEAKPASSGKQAS